MRTRNFPALWHGVLMAAGLVLGTFGMLGMLLAVESALGLAQPGSHLSLGAVSVPTAILLVSLAIVALGFVTLRHAARRALREAPADAHAQRQKERVLTHL